MELGVSQLILFVDVDSELLCKVAEDWASQAALIGMDSLLIIIQFHEGPSCHAELTNWIL